jgi:type IV pilus assembly protein PilY1
LLSLSYSVNGGTAQPVITNRSITASNGPLPSSFRFGFSAGTGGGSNVHEITCFKAAPVGQSSSSAGTNVQQTARIEAGTQLYLAYYHANNWWGELTAQTMGVDAKTGKFTINTAANWDASCTLTGGACPAMSSTATVTAQTPTARQILTWSGASGVPFQWASLTSAQQTALTAGDASATDARLQYLRGDRTYEVNNGGSFRTRTGVLGDIINSSPTWVGGPSAPYTGTWKDSLYPKAGAAESSYASFKTTNGQRLNVVYLGSNDGMLHGFRSGSYDASGNFVANATTPNDGQEVLAYMPAAILNTIHSGTSTKLDFSSPSYAHSLYVDATPGTGDLYYNGAWHTWLVGGLGGGANAAGPIGDSTSTGAGAIYALDVTDPTTFNETNASKLVIGEWTPSTISCANYTTTSCGGYLGNTYGTPVIRRLHNGSWAVLFGNGLNSQNGTAGMYIMLVDSTSGNVTFRYLDTGYGPSQDPTGNSNKNGIAYVTPADLDGDHITDYVYAGDAFGNIWRFDLTSQDPALWSVSSGPLFSTSAGQPITSKVVVASIPGVGSVSAYPRVLVSFGTGQAFPATLTSPATYASTGQALYGVWDWDMQAWNAMAPAGARYTSLAGPQNVITASSLLQQSITADVAATATTVAQRVVSSYPVCWQGSTACKGVNNQWGWTLPLPTGKNEQVVYNPVLQFGVFNVNTIIPAVQQILSCSATPASGYSMGVSVANGGATTNPYFLDANGKYLTVNGTGVSGVGFSGTGTSSFVSIGNGQYQMVTQSADNTPKNIGVNPNAAGVGSRLNWVKLR